MFEVPEQLLQQILNYLAQRPYADVFQLIQQIQQLKKRIDEGSDV